MKCKKLIAVALSAVLAGAAAGCLAACGDPAPADGYERLSSKDLPATASVIGLDSYRDKVKGGLAGSMAGVSYGFYHEFIYRTWQSQSTFPQWTPGRIVNGYDQDDIYLAVTAIEAFSELGLDATARELGIYMYNKNFEFWDGSNNDVLARGFAPPYSGYPKQATGYYTNAFSDGNSYQCGASFGGYLGLNMTGASNELTERLAQICTYGDGIYAAQYIAAMYGAAFFTDDIGEIIEAGLAAIPEASWSAEIIRDVLANKEAGMNEQQNYESIMKKWVDYDGKFNSPYQWIEWPSDMLLDAKVCSAFTTIGLLYGNGDIEKSMKITMQCENDSDSTAAATVGILGVIKGFENFPEEYKSGLIENQMIKYSRLTVDGVADTCKELIGEIVTRQGGKVAYVDGVLSLVIPEAARQAEIGAYKPGKTATKADLGEPVLYTDEEMARLRYFADPGFEGCSNEARNGSSSGYLANGWATDKSANVSVEFRKQSAYTGQNTVRLTASEGQTVSLWNPTNRALSKQTNYELSCMVQLSEGFCSEFKLAVWNSSGMLLRAQAAEVQEGWFRVTLVFNTGNNTDVRIGAQLTGANGADFVRVDDFELRLK